MSPVPGKHPPRPERAGLEAARATTLRRRFSAFGETAPAALSALAAYVFWGLAPIYFKWIQAVPPPPEEKPRRSRRRPVLLALLGLPASQEMPGRVLRDNLTAAARQAGLELPLREDLTAEMLGVLAGSDFIARTGQRFGAQHVIDVLRGSESERVRRFGHDRLSTYGIGADLAKGPVAPVRRDLGRT